MSSEIDRFLSRGAILVLILGVGATLFAVDLGTLKPFQDPKEFFILEIGGLAGIVWALRLLVSPRARRSLLWLIPLLPLLTIACWRFYSTWEGRGSEIMGFGSGLEFQYLLRICLFGLSALICFCLTSGLEMDRRNARLITSILMLFALVEVISVFVEILGDLYGQEWHPFLGYGTVDSDPGELKTTYFGSLGNTNFLAGYLAILFFTILPAGFRWRNRALQTLNLLLPIAVLCVLIVCRSKGALLGCVFGGVIYGYAQWQLRRSRRSTRIEPGARPRGPQLGSVGLLGILIVGAIMVGSGYQKDGFSTLVLRGESISKRIFLAYTGLEMLKDSPWIGIGPGAFRLRFLETVGEILQSEEGAAFRSRVQNLKSFKPVHLHNDPLEVLVEWGVVGYTAMVIFLLLTVLVAFERIRTDPPDLARRRIGWIAGFSAGLGYSLFEFPFHLPPHLFLAAFLLGLSVACSGRNSKSAFLFSGILPALVALSLSGFLLFQAMHLGVAAHLAQSAWANPKSKKSEVNEAYDQVRLANRLDPGNAEIALLLGQFQWRTQNRLAEAVQTLRSAATISDDPLVSLFEAQIALDENRIQDAFRAIEPLAGIADFLPGVGYIQGRIARSLDKPEEAAEAFLRDIRASSRFPNPEKVTPDLPGLYLNYGEALEMLGQFREAVWQYEKHNELIAERGANIPIGYLRLGQIYRDRFSDFETARHYFDQALKSAQKHASASEIQLVKEEIRQLGELVRQIRTEFPLQLQEDNHSP